MCGIAGYIDTSEYPIERMLQAIRHRGPDDQGTYKSVCGPYRIVLGHRRLNILDLSSAAHQPMIEADGRYVMCYNGELYNYKTLAEKYLKGVRFRSTGDTEVLLRLWATVGERLLPEMNGDFAFCIWDEVQKTLTLARDRAGVKPLYYMISDHGVMFGSELAVFLQSGIPVTENVEALRSYFVFKYYPGSETPLEGVRRVPPGHCLVYHAPSRKLEIKPFWSVCSVEATRNADYRESVLQLRELLGGSVQSRLMADVPVGNFISGGVDSSGIAYFMRDVPGMLHHCARKREEDLRVEGTSSDAGYAARLAADWGLDVRYYDIGYDNRIEELIRTTIRYSDDLIADGSQIPSFLITAAAARHSTVLLSGMGADELFLGYGGHILTLLSQYIDRLPGVVASGITTLLSRLETGKGRFKGNKRFLKKLGAYEGYGSVKYGLFSIVGDYERSNAIVQLGDDPLEYISSYFDSGASPFDSLTRFEYDNFLVKNLHYLDRMCMANSVEGRVPYLDPDIIAFALSLPREFKLTGLGRSKRILKDALKGLIPDYILTRRKAGFGMPLRSMFMNELVLRKLLRLDFFLERPHFDVPHIERLIAEHLRGHNDNSSMLYALVSYRIWHEEVFSARAA